MKRKLVTLLFAFLGCMCGLLLMSGVIAIMLAPSQADAQYQKPSLEESIQLGTRELRRALEESTRATQSLTREVRDLNRSMSRR